MQVFFWNIPYCILQLSKRELCFRIFLGTSPAHISLYLFTVHFHSLIFLVEVHFVVISIYSQILFVLWQTDWLLRMLQFLFRKTRILVWQLITKMRIGNRFFKQKELQQHLQQIIKVFRIFFSFSYKGFNHKYIKVGTSIPKSRGQKSILIRDELGLIVF